MKTPVILDGRYVHAFTAYYVIACLWGIVASVQGTVSIAQTGGPVYQAFWAALVAAISLALAILSEAHFYRVEKWFTVAWLAVVSAYPASIIYQWLAGDAGKAAASISTVLYLVFPFTMYIHLIRKTKKTDG